MKTPTHSTDSHSAIASGESLPLENQATINSWMPRPWSDELLGCVFLPRMLEKGRRVLESERTGRDLMNGFLFGDVEYADKQMLGFLKTNETRVRQLLSEHSDDAAVATILFREGSRSAEDIQEWNRHFRRKNAPFTPMWDADEGRRAPGIGTSLLSFFYNYIMMPPVYLLFRIQNASNQRRLSLNAKD